MSATKSKQVTKKQQNKQASERLQNERARARRQRGDGRAKRLMRPKEETKKTGDGVLTFSAVLKMPVIFLSLSLSVRAKTLEQKGARVELGVARAGASIRQMGVKVVAEGISGRGKLVTNEASR